MRKPLAKLIAFSDVGAFATGLRVSGKRIVTTNGCFDILHRGHIEYLAEARLLGDSLIVGINSDRSVHEIKSPTRPLHDETTRAIQVAALESVDAVVIFDQSNPIALLEQIRPFLHVKGGDYLATDLPERVIVERYGGSVQCLKIVSGFSTSQIINQISSRLESK